MLDVRRAADRFVTSTHGVVSRHSFSFGRHYYPANTSYGILLACNEEQLAPGAGFPDHRHRDLEIVTWVLEGALLHRDSTGRTAQVGPGVLAHLTAGTGVVHAESNAAAEPTRFVQLWLEPDQPGAVPAYQQRDVGKLLTPGLLVTVGRISRRAVLHVARLEADQAVELPGEEQLHLLVGRGEVLLQDVPLAAGDAARLPATAGRGVVAAGPAELLVLAMSGSGWGTVSP